MLQVVRERAETKLMAKINKRRITAMKNSPEKDKGGLDYEGQSPFQKQVAQKIMEKSKILSVKQSETELAKTYVDPLDLSHYKNYQRKKYRAYTQDMTRSEVTHTIVKHMTPKFVDNVIQVAVYKNLFARATARQEQRIRDRELQERREQVKKVKARKTRLAAIKLKKTPKGKGGKDGRRSSVHPVQYARYGVDLKHLERAIEEGQEHVSYR